MKDKHQELEKDSGSLLNPYLSMALALFFPGAGHFALGRKARALVFALIVLRSEERREERV